MLKIIGPIILFIFIIYAITCYWEKANTINKKKNGSHSEYNFSYNAVFYNLSYH